MKSPESLIDKAKKLLTRKNHDYTSGQGTRYENFERSAIIASWFKSDIDKSFANHVGNKIARLATLLDAKEPVNESIEDTFVDLVNYCALWGANRTENK